jgi:hypothetical protein
MAARPCGIIGRRKYANIVDGNVSIIGIARNLEIDPGEDGHVEESLTHQSPTRAARRRNTEKRLTV